MLSSTPCWMDPFRVSLRRPTPKQAMIAKSDGNRITGRTMQEGLGIEEVASIGDRRRTQYFETRNPKFKTNSNDQKAENSKQVRSRILNFGFECFVCFGLRLWVSGFDFLENLTICSERRS